MVEQKFFLPGLIDRMQQETGEQMQSGHRKLDYGTPTDDDEVTLPLYDRVTEV